jgi:hypothetical protein
MSDTRDVSGVWYGSWSSEDPNIDPSGFIALLEESGGTVGGSISEPDPYSGETLRAFVSGSRSGAQISWTKQYDGEGPLAHSVHYSGAVNGDATEITGRWMLERHSGSFTMQREKFTAEELEEREEIELETPLR